MPEAIKTTIEVDGESREVEVPLPDGYLSPEEVRDSYVAKDIVEKKVLKRIESAKKGLVDPVKLTEDPDFVRRFAMERKDTILEVLGVNLTGNEPDLEGLRGRWREAELAPLQTELETRDTRIGRLLEKSWKATALGAMTEANVREELFEVVPLWLRGRVKFDEEYDDFFVVDGEGEFEYTASPEKGKPPYKTATELLIETSRDKTKAAWYKPTGKGGVGYKGGSGGPRGRISLDDFEKMSQLEQRAVYDEDPTLYSELMAALAERNTAKLFDR